MVMMEYFADAPACAFGNLARPLDGANAGILAGHRRTLAHIARGVDRVQRYQIARTFSNALGRRSRAFGSPLANVSSPASNVSARTALLGPLSRMRCRSRLRRLRLSVLAPGILPAQRKA
jgi:hypothetical protein